MEEKKRAKLGVYPSHEFKKIIDSEAENEGRSVSNYVLNILKNHINQKKQNEKVEEVVKP